jgi:hypothetical protein
MKLLLLALCLMAMGFAAALDFEMQTQTKCIFEELNANVIVVGDYKATNKDNPTLPIYVDVKVRGDRAAQRQCQLQLCCCPAQVLVSAVNPAAGWYRHGSLLAQHQQLEQHQQLDDLFCRCLTHLGLLYMRTKHSTKASSLSQPSQRESTRLASLLMVRG